MKKVLVTGASGNIGYYVIKYLLMEGKYEITALDLSNKKTIKKLKKYRNRINVVEGDILDPVLMSSLVKDHDYIIHLAGLMPPLGDLNESLGSIIEIEGTENIIKAINKYNPECFLMYASTTSLYDFSLGASTKEKIKENVLTSYSLNKLKTENLIKKKLKNYTIFRLPLVLSDLKGEPFIYNIKKNLVVEVTTNVDAAYAFVKAINYKSELNTKIFNVGMGEDGRVIFGDILNNILKYYGLSMTYILKRVFLAKNYNSPILTDSDILENIIHYRTDSLNSYYKRIKNKGRDRVVQKLLAKPILGVSKIKKSLKDTK